MTTRKVCCGSDSCLGSTYDALGQVISILDVITDVIVCYQYHQADRMVFFGISVTILMLALIAYDVAFVASFVDDGKLSTQIKVFVIMLPLSPIIPYLLFFTADPKSCCAKRLRDDICCFTIYLEDRVSAPAEYSKLRQFMESKILKHLGFIIEALVEAFPQAILQMVAIVVFKEANLVSIISILLSMISVASKSFVFSIAFALTVKQLLWNWLSAVTDFFGIFFVMSFVFYEPHSDELKPAFALFFNVWLYRLYSCTAPFVLFVCLVLYGMLFEDFGSGNLGRNPSRLQKCCARSMAFLMVTVMFVCALVAFALVSEILIWVWPALLFFLLGTERFGETRHVYQFFFGAMAWIDQASAHHIGTLYSGLTSYTKYQDKMMRLCSFHSVLYSRHTGNVDSVCKTFLDQQMETQYMNVQMSDFRTHSSDVRRTEFVQLFWHLYGDLWREVTNEWPSNPAWTLKKWVSNLYYVVCAGLVTWLLAPIYFVSRIAMLFFPTFIVLHLYVGYGVNVWNTAEIDTFQIVMLSIYIALCSAVWILFVLNCVEQYLMHHILPSLSGYQMRQTTGTASATANRDQLLKDVYNHYYCIVVIPVRAAIIMNHFGDLGRIILSYLPNKDEYEYQGEIVRTQLI